MKKNDTVFLMLICFSVSLLGIILTDNVRAARKPASPLVADKTVAKVAVTEEKSSQSEALRARFKSLGLPLHEGKYWKEIK